MKSRKLVPIKRVGFLTRKELTKWTKSRLITCILKLQTLCIKRAVVTKVKSRRLKSKKRRSAKQKRATKRLIAWNKRHR